MRFIDLIKMDLYAVSTFLNGTDEINVNLSAYHTQQAVEKTCAYVAQQFGIKTLRTHNILEWIEYLEKNKISVPQEIRKSAREITEWATSPRYNINFSTARGEVESVFNCCSEWLAEVESSVSLSVIFD